MKTVPAVQGILGYQAFDMPVMIVVVVMMMAPAQCSYTCADSDSLSLSLSLSLVSLSHTRVIICFLYRCTLYDVYMSYLGPYPL